MPSPPITTTEIVLPGVVEPEGLIVRRRELPESEPEARTIIVKVLATGVSSAENAMRRNRYPGQPEFPFVPGYDLVGEVVAVAAIEDEQLVGRRVAAVVKTGGWASHVELDARSVLMLPTDIEAATVEAALLNGITAWQMLNRHAHVGTGGTILVHGASGGVGSLLVQMARRQGIRVIGTGSEPSHEWLAQLGAEPLDPGDRLLADRLAAAAPDGFDAVFDNIGGPSFTRSFRGLARGGTLVAYGTHRQREKAGNMALAFVGILSRFTLWTLAPNGGRSAIFYTFWGGNRLAPVRFHARLQTDLDSVLALIRAGDLQVRIAHRFPLEQAAEALRLIDGRSPHGKVILEP